MKCCCNTYNEMPLQFLDIEGVRYLVAVMGKYIDDGDANAIATAKAYTESKVAELKEYVDAQQNEMKEYVDTLIAQCMPADAIAIDGSVVTFKLPNGTTATFDLAKGGSGISDAMFATNADIDAMF